MAADINVVPAIERFGDELRHDPEETRRDMLIAILKRWEHDRDLTSQSRRRATELVWEFDYEPRSPALTSYLGGHAMMPPSVGGPLRREVP
jgi:hypothetical protein